MFASEFQLGLELGSVEVLGVLLYKDQPLERYVRQLFYELMVHKSRLSVTLDYF